MSGTFTWPASCTTISSQIAAGSSLLTITACGSGVSTVNSLSTTNFTSGVSVAIQLAIRYLI